MPGSMNPFTVLNVSPDADPVVIEAAHKALMKKYHPDRLGAGAGDAGRAAMINEAFAILKDPKRRAEYHLRHLPHDRVVIHMPPPPSSGLRMAAWSGWLTAIAVGVALGVTLMAHQNQTPTGRSETPTLASAETPAPILDEPRGLFAADVTIAAAAAAPIVGSAAIAATLPAEPAVEAEPKPREVKPYKVRKAAPKRAPAPSARAADRDFLEREGYIY